MRNDCNTYTQTYIYLFDNLFYYHTQRNATTHIYLLHKYSNSNRIANISEKKIATLGIQYYIKYGLRINYEEYLNNSQMRPSNFNFSSALDGSITKTDRQTTRAKLLAAVIRWFRTFSFTSQERRRDHAIRAAALANLHSWRALSSRFSRGDPGRHRNTTTAVPPPHPPQW